MPPNRHRLRPGVEALDVRVVLSASTLAAPTHLTPGQFPSANANRTFTPADLQAYAAAYLSFRGSPGYVPQFDFNGTGFIGQNDATPILRGLAGISPKGPLNVVLKLAPGQQARLPHPSQSGGVTHFRNVTVVGKTTPNSIVFIDGPTGNYRFDRGAVATDARGRFEYQLKLEKPSRGGSLTNTEVLIRTPSGEQTIRAFPIRLLPRR
ncbi:hypothetical protein P12x_001786 [Tundrisphaera lichenicola]|uniref:hypothetical protein n=1 Tax=Tundrisphaera lichenicola TaxID=2029860 RepID=UPI003EBF5A4F